MKKLILSIAFSILFTFNALSHVEHYTKFNSLKYELFRNNDLIGFHNYYFEKKDNTTIVKSEVQFEIVKLGISLYKYKAVSEEIYENDKFKKFKSNTKQNKKDKFVNINLNENGIDLDVNGSSFKGKTSKDFIVGTWWNHEIIKAKAQISAISGRVIQQKVSFVGKEQIYINDKMYNALHFNFSSSDKDLPKEKKLNTDIWYDEKNYIWLKASFDKQGHWEYRLKTSK